MLWHLNYEIDKNKYKNIFYKNIQRGQWHWTVPDRQELYWYQLMSSRKQDGFLRDELRPVEEDLGIWGMDSFPRFSYQFPNTVLPHHLDEDQMVAININLMDTTPIIHIEHEPYPYECALIDVGHHMHGVEADPNHRLILKFCLRHPLDEVMERMYDKNIITRGSGDPLG